MRKIFPSPPPSYKNIFNFKRMYRRTATIAAWFLHFNIRFEVFKDESKAFILTG